jgi:hypothetical protein
MNRRQFIKAAAPAVVIPAIAITCKYEDDEKGPEKESKAWPYRVFCYEREQGEWTFSRNIRGSFDYQREYMTFEEDKGWPYAGWMDGGVLHFQTLDDATDFVEMHVRAKDDINLIDSIYDVYYKDLDYEHENNEVQVAHYWFNGDTGRQVHWIADGPFTNFSEIECA